MYVLWARFLIRRRKHVCFDPAHLEFNATGKTTEMVCVIRVLVVSQTNAVISPYPKFVPSTNCIPWAPCDPYVKLLQRYNFVSSQALVMANNVQTNGKIYATKAAPERVADGDIWWQLVMSILETFWDRSISVYLFPPGDLMCPRKYWTSMSCSFFWRIS